jgi:hypothetical protein
MTCDREGVKVSLRSAPELCTIPSIMAFTICRRDGTSALHSIVISELGDQHSRMIFGSRQASDLSDNNLLKFLHSIVKPFRTSTVSQKTSFVLEVVQLDRPKSWNHNKMIPLAALTSQCSASHELNQQIS